MKQNKDGKKIQNWHKPMHQGAFKNRFLRRRHVDPELQLPKETALPSGQLTPMLSQEVDACWNYRDPHGFGWEDENTFEGNYSHFLWTIFNEVNRPPNNPFGPLLANLEPIASPDGDLDDDSIQQSDIPLVDRLRSFLDVIQGLPKQFEAFRDSIQERMKDTESLETLRSAANNRELIYSVDYEHRIYDLHHRLWLFSPFWIRTPKTWNGEDGWEGLIRHLLVQYEPPKFLYREWYDENFPRFKWIVWFLLFSQGGSLKGAAKLFGWNIATGFPSHLYHAHEQSSPVQACMFAEILRLGASLEVFDMLDHAYTIDPTETRNPLFISFWQDTIQWLFKKTDEINQFSHTVRQPGDYTTRLILDWAMHKYTESERGNEVLFSWQGRQVRQTFETSREYWQSLHCESEMNLSWASHGWDWHTTDERGDKWAVVELSSGKALHDEGKRMHHCVGGYAYHCVAGYISIFSLRLGGVGKVTIQLEPNSKVIDQARGHCNQSITRREHEVISQWLKEVVRYQPTELNESV